MNRGNIAVIALIISLVLALIAGGVYYSSLAPTGSQVATPSKPTTPDDLEKEVRGIVIDDTSETLDPVTDAAGL